MNITTNKIGSESVVGGVIIALGIFFLSQSLKVPVSPYDSIGPRTVPMVLSAVIIMLGIVSIIVDVLNNYAKNKDESKSHMYALLLITILGFAYIWLFKSFGYLVSTIIVLFSLLLIFGNRNIYKSFAIASGGALAYYIIFIKLLMTYDPPGELINFQSFLPL